MIIQAAQCHQDAKSELATWNFEHSFTQSSKTRNCIGLAVPGFHVHFGLHQKFLPFGSSVSDFSDILQSYHQFAMIWIPYEKSLKA